MNVSDARRRDLYNFFHRRIRENPVHGHSWISIAIVPEIRNDFCEKMPLHSYHSIMFTP